MAVDRVRITPAAAKAVRRLRGRHGDLLFHQSGGCCDGSAPMCNPIGEFRVGSQDVYQGTVEGCPVYIGAAPFQHWKHAQLSIDVVPGRGSGSSVEAPERVRFLTRSRICTDEEWAELEQVQLSTPIPQSAEGCNA
jgi:uncharacterized protein (DUF779 family)